MVLPFLPPPLFLSFFRDVMLKLTISARPLPSGKLHSQLLLDAVFSPIRVINFKGVRRLPRSRGTRLSPPFSSLFLSSWFGASLFPLLFQARLPFNKTFLSPACACLRLECPFCFLIFSPFRSRTMPVHGAMREDMMQFAILGCAKQLSAVHLPRS